MEGSSKFLLLGYFVVIKQTILKLWFNEFRPFTYYLLLLCWLPSMCLPVGYFMGADAAVYTFKPLGVQVGEVFNSTWGMFGILLLSTIIALGTIFLFKNRHITDPYVYLQ